MTQEEIERIGSFLDSFGTMSLATHGPDGPWAATVFFARDDQLNLYFISNPDSRHIREMHSSNTVAATVNGDHDTWDDIRGVQIAGIAGAVPARQRPATADRYLRKFPKIRRVVEQPLTAVEESIAARFHQSGFHVIRPTMIRLIDNTRGFGHKREFFL